MADQLNTERPQADAHPRPVGASASRSARVTARNRRAYRAFYFVFCLVALIGAWCILIVVRTTRTPSATIVLPKISPGATESDSSRPTGYILGDARAPVEIVEYIDFECPTCAQFANSTEPVLRARLIETGLARLRVYPFQVVPQHRRSPAASLAAACADEQGKFWEMHDRLFARQEEWNTHASGDPRDVFEKYAEQGGLDVARWRHCYDDRTYLPRLTEHQREAARAGVDGTPSFVIGTRRYVGLPPIERLEAAVDSTAHHVRRTAAGP